MKIFPWIKLFFRWLNLQRGKVFFALLSTLFSCYIISIEVSAILHHLKSPLLTHNQVFVQFRKMGFGIFLPSIHISENILRGNSSNACHICRSSRTSTRNYIFASKRKSLRSLGDQRFLKGNNGNFYSPNGNQKLGLKTHDWVDRKKKLSSGLKLGSTPIALKR